MKPKLTRVADFGTDAFPLRPSQLAKLTQCNFMALLDLTGVLEDDGSAAAETGSLTHEAVAEFHRQFTKSLAERTTAGIQAIESAQAKFPRGDPHEAKIYFAHYATDPRNQNARLVAIEQKVNLRLPPHESDPTGKEIVIAGTLDQIREEHGVLKVYDYKTGQKTGVEMLNMYAIQLATYLLAARASGFPVTEAYLIRGYSYRNRGAVLPSPDGVFWSMPFTIRGAEILLESIRFEVAKIRRGYADFKPGAHCSFCPARGYDKCIPLCGTKFGFPT